MIQAIKDQRGVAMLLALLTMSFMVVLTVQLSTEVNQQVHASRDMLNRVRQRDQLLSSLAIVRAALFADYQNKKGDSYLDVWATLQQENLDALFGTPAPKIQITDCTGLLQVNALVQEQQPESKQNTVSPKVLMEKHYALWLRFLLSGAFAIEDEQEAKTIIDCLCDWLDTDEDVRENGAESSYYQSLSPGYTAGNRPISHLSELALIKGMSRKLLYGENEKEGLINYLTSMGADGKININTAPPALLKALNSGLTEDMVEAMVAFRGDEENRDALESVEWVNKVAAVPGDIIYDTDLITVQATHFRVQIHSTDVTGSQQAEGILRRDVDGSQRLLSWYVE